MDTSVLRVENASVLLKQKKQVQFSSSTAEERMVFLDWVPFGDLLPSNAVSIDNDYVGHTDYVCKYGCDTGFYTPGKGPYCYYPSSGKEHKGTPFDILVNKDNFELLEWKDDSYGSVPQHSVCPCSNVCVGKNQYGLGKVDLKNKAFFLPYVGKEYWYKYYQVLTISDSIVSQKFYEVQYSLPDYKVTPLNTVVLTQSTTKNSDCQPAEKTDTLETTYQVAKTWEISSSVGFGVKTTITAGIPELFSTSVEISMDVTFQFSEGTTVTESITASSSLKYTVPPNHSCKVLMKAHKTKLNIPFTARLSRTYGDEKMTTTQTLITGMYDGTYMLDIESELGQCKILDKSKKC